MIKVRNFMCFVHIVGRLSLLDLPFTFDDYSGEVFFNRVKISRLGVGFGNY